MPYYEVVFETGRTSVGFAADDEEALSGAREHDKRAREGQQGGPQGGPAERIVKLFKYDKHPDDYNSDQTASADVVASELTGILDDLKDSNGVVNLQAVAQSVQALSHPLKTERETLHDSIYKMESVGELTLDEAPPASGKGSK
jgi:hypothetical protein